MEDPAAPELLGCQGLEQFLLLAKTAKGPAVIELVKQALGAPGVYVFGELLEAECIQELAAGPNACYLQLLEVFAYGTYSDYKSNISSLPALTPIQLTKLKHLTIIALAAKCRTIPYSTLLQELDIENVRELEDLVIEAIYAGIIQAKLDQKNAQLEVECFIGRDIKMAALDGMVEKLESWCTNCATVLQVVEEQIQRANQMKSDKVKEKEKTEHEIKELKQTLKVAAEQEEPHHLGHHHHHAMPGTRETFGKPGKKGIRGSATSSKFFGRK